MLVDYAVMDLKQNGNINSDLRIDEKCLFLLRFVENENHTRAW